MTTTVPERYRPDPWVDSRIEQRSIPRNTGIAMPTIAVRDFMKLDGGREVGFAPKGPDSVWIGETVPRVLAGRTVYYDSQNNAYPRLWIPKTINEYLDLELPTRVRWHDVDRDRDVEYPRVVMSVRDMAETETSDDDSDQVTL